MFHRLAVPTYFGGLPVGYDLINDPTHISVGGSGVAAFADGQKAGGPNDGTYFVAFGEDATSENTNRGLKALSENTDLLDDILHKDLAISVRTANATAGGGGVSSIALAGQVYVGDNGTANNQEQRNRLVSVLDANDNEIIDASGATVQVSLIHDGSNNNVLGTQASGFYNGPTITLSPAIPAGTVYRVVYGERSNLASLPKNAFMDIRIRGAQEVDGDVEKQLRDLHAPSALQAWNDPWDSTIRALAAAGLNERYRRQTTVPGSFTFNSPGNGAQILRDGQAVTILAADIDVSAATNPDSQLALLKLLHNSAAVAGGSWPDRTRGGDIGIWHESDFNNTNTSSEHTRAGSAGPGFMDVVPRDIRAGTISGQDALFFINNTATCILNPTSGGTTAAKATIEAPAGQYFKITAGGNAGKTSLRIGVDMVEVEFVDGTKKTFVIDDITSNTRITVKHMSGKAADFGATAINTAKIRVFQPMVSLGGVIDTSDSPSDLPFVFFGMPPFIRADHLDPTVMEAPYFSAASMAGHDEAGPSSKTKKALRWGGYGTDGFQADRGYLLGDGSIYSFGGRIFGELFCLDEHPQGFNTGANSLEINPYVNGSLIHLNSASAHGSSTTVTIAFAAGYIPTTGDQITIMIRLAANSVGPISFTWPASFVFSGSDGTVPSSTGPSEMVIKYTFIYVNAKWYATRTDN